MPDLEEFRMQRKLEPAMGGESLKGLNLESALVQAETSESSF